MRKLGACAEVACGPADCLSQNRSLNDTLHKERAGHRTHFRQAKYAKVLIVPHCGVLMKGVVRKRALEARFVASPAASNDIETYIPPHAQFHIPHHIGISRIVETLLGNPAGLQVSSSIINSPRCTSHTYAGQPRPTGSLPLPMVIIQFLHEGRCRSVLRVYSTIRCIFDETSQMGNRRSRPGGALKGKEDASAETVGTSIPCCTMCRGAVGDHRLTAGTVIRTCPIAWSATSFLPR